MIKRIAQILNITPTEVRAKFDKMTDVEVAAWLSANVDKLAEGRVA